MKIKSLAIIGLSLTLSATTLFIIFAKRPKADDSTVITADTGPIESSILVTGTVEPQNRLEIRPPVSGRIDEILVSEGQKVTAGTILALMSSTDRAALLDAARMQSQNTLGKWQDIYKPAPLIAPVDGEVIVRAAKPGQTVSASDAVVVLSDRLIVKAQVDETDVGRLAKGQKAIIDLDAYPGATVEAVVDHIYYESRTVNNVTIYPVDILPLSVPEHYRSGMNATVRIIRARVENALLIPLQTVRGEGDTRSVTVLAARGSKSEERTIKVGISDDSRIQVLEGLTQGELIVVDSVDFSTGGTKKADSSPFMPNRPGRGSRPR